MFKKFLIASMATLLLFGSTSGYAQGVNKDDDAGLTGPRKQLATIIFAGLGGAILGLSTLSFYGRPQDNLKNIAIGFAVGVIGGTAFASYKAAVRPGEFYGDDFGAEANFDFYRFYRNKEPTVGPVYLSWNF